MTKFAIITGGSKGIGKAIVRKFLVQGFEVITCARHEKDLQVLKKELLQAIPHAKLHIYKADLSKKEELNFFTQFTQKLTSQIEILVNNVGFFVPGQIHQEEEGVLESMIEANLYSAYYLTKALVPVMIAQKQGSIFNICSTASITPYTNGGSYCISKYALYGMTKVLREEMKPYGIKVTAVLPGATLTASWEGTTLPVERFIKPEDVADTIWDIYQLSPNTVVEEILIRPQLGDL